MKINGAMVFTGEGFYQRDIYTDGELVVPYMSNSGGEVDARGCYAIPGLIDIHLHGCVRGDFSSAGAPKLKEMALYQAQNGITAICPTTMTLSEDTLSEACRQIVSLPATDGAALAGIHLEGPFLSPDKPGAQNPAYIQAPDIALFQRLQAAAQGTVRLLAIAPEAPGALELIKAVSGQVCCSLAHTTADYDTAMSAYRAGARHLTHMFNAMPPLSHREPGVIGAAFDSPGCRVELIADGVHVHPSVIRAAFKLFGDNRIVLVSDSMMATGLGDGMYELGDQEVQVVGNTARLTSNGSIAGSVTNLMNCLRTAVQTMGIPLYSAVKCASVNAAKAIGIYDKRGSIAPGKFADIVLLEQDLSIRQVILRGRSLPL